MAALRASAVRCRPHDRAGAVFLLLGVLGGTVLALLGGLAAAARAMRPIVQLTEAAREIERTRDPTLRLPHPEADDEVAELARTVEGMLYRSTLPAATLTLRSSASASSLPTPRTSCAHRSRACSRTSSCLPRSSRASRPRPPRRRSARPAGCGGSSGTCCCSPAPMRGEPSRAAPPTSLTCCSRRRPSSARWPRTTSFRQCATRGRPGCPRRPPSPHAQPDRERRSPHTAGHAYPGGHRGRRRRGRARPSRTTARASRPSSATRVFERFVRGAGTGARGSGLGLAIVRAVAESHGGSVSLEKPELGTGTRFVIKIPRSPAARTSNRPIRGSARPREAPAAADALASRSLASGCHPRTSRVGRGCREAAFPRGVRGRHPAARSSSGVPMPMIVLYCLPISKYFDPHSEHALVPHRRHHRHRNRAPACGR